MEVVPPKYVSFRAVLTISTSTSLKKHRNFTLKHLVQHYENMIPLSFLGLTISVFLPFSKAVKCNRRILDYFSI